MNDKNKKTILLVEDEAILAITEKLVLEKYGYKIHTADSGEKAIELFNKNNDIDLILMDIDLGKGLDGPETASIILKERDIPVVFLSSHTEPAVVEKTEKITSYGYVVKSSSITVLDASIKMAFKLFESKRNEQMKEAVLQESEEKYRLLHENAGLGIAYYSIDGLVYSYNQYAAKNMNGVPEDFNGKSIYDIFPKSDADFYLDRIKKAALSEDPVTYDDMITLPSGNKYFLSTFTRIVGKNKKLLGIQIISQETTEIKQTKKKLHESKKNTETLLNISSEIILSLDFHGNIVLLNENGHRLLGYTSPELIEKNWFDTCLPIEMREGIWQYFEKLKSGATDIYESYENEVITKSGERKVVSWHNILLKDKNENFMGIFSSGEDITERKQKENIIREYSLRLENIIEGTHVGTWEWNVQTGDTVFNQLWAEIVGYTLEELAPVSIKTWKTLAHPDDLKKSEELLAKHFAGELPYYHFESRMKHKDGHWVWVIDRGKVIKWSADGIPLMMYGTHTDINERKIAEDLIEQSENKWRMLFDVLPVGVSILDANYKISDMNQKLETILDITHEGLYNELYKQRKYLRFDGSPMEPDEFPSSIAIREQRVVRNVEVGIVKQNGVTIWTNVNAAPLNIEGSACVLVTQDITELKKVTEELQVNQWIFNQFLEYSPVHIYIKDEKLRLLKLSQTMVDLLGKPLGELIGKDSYELVPPEFAESAIADDLKVLKDKVPVEVREEMNGRVYTTIKFPIYRGEGKPYYLAGFSIDISDRKIAEDNIKSLLAEKELILKEVHHRLKNNMNTVKGLLSLQIAFLKDPQAISAIQDTISRVDSMVVLYDKLYCSHNFNDISVLTYLPSLIDEIIGNFPGSESVKVEKKIDDFILEVKKLQPLGIIINELLTNTMKYAFTGRDNNLISVSATLTDQKVSIIISDNGNGIPESVTFENSTGFGMQLVSMLTEQMGGNITIERESERERERERTAQGSFWNSICIEFPLTD